jgi:apolipoprotein N-acyltransferase
MAGYLSERRAGTYSRAMILQRVGKQLSQLTGWRKAGLLLAAGALAGLSMPPLDLWPGLFAAFPVLAILIRDRSMRSAFGAGFCFGLGYFSACLYWIGIAFLVDAATYLWMMPIMVGALAGGMALYWGAATAVTAALRRKDLVHLILLGVFFGIAEWLRGHLLTGFPWTVPGLAAMGMGPLDQTAALIGMPGLTVLIVLWASLPALLLDALRDRREVIVAVILLALLPALALWGAWRLAQASEDVVAGVKLRIVQPSIPQDEKWREGNARAIFEEMLELSQQASAQSPNGISDITHIIWPESALPFYVDENTEALATIDAMLNPGKTLIMGAVRRDLGKRDAADDYAAYNSVVALDDAANIVARYDKWRLVPGGEFLPFESILAPMGFRKLVTVPGSFTAGPGPQSVAIPFAPLSGMLVCYEAIFPDLIVDSINRPEWLINVTNDGWFGRSNGPYQHLAQARMRAIEQGLPMARAANTGISAVIDGYGRVRSSLALGERGVIDTELPRSVPGATLYARIGDWGFGVLLTVLLGLAAILNATIHQRETKAVA